MPNWKHNWFNKTWRGCQLLLQWMSEAATDSWQRCLTARNGGSQLFMSRHTPKNVFPRYSCKMKKKEARAFFQMLLTLLHILKFMQKTNKNKIAQFWFGCCKYGDFHFSLCIMAFQACVQGQQRWCCVNKYIQSQFLFLKKNKPKQLAVNTVCLF